MNTLKNKSVHKKSIYILIFVVSSKPLNHIKNISKVIYFYISLTEFFDSMDKLWSIYFSGYRFGIDVSILTDIKSNINLIYIEWK